MAPKIRAFGVGDPCITSTLRVILRKIGSREEKRNGNREQTGEKMNSPDNESLSSYDQMTLVQVVEKCEINASWDEPIDFDKYGWHQDGNRFPDY